jgi:hypothetical protein
MNEVLDKTLLAVLVGLPALYGISRLSVSGPIARMAALFQSQLPLADSSESQRLRLLDEARDLYDESPADCRVPLETVILSLLRTNQAPQKEVRS